MRAGTASRGEYREARLTISERHPLERLLSPVETEQPAALVERRATEAGAGSGARGRNVVEAVRGDGPRQSYKRGGWTILVRGVDAHVPPGAEVLYRFEGTD